MLQRPASLMRARSLRSPMLRVLALAEPGELGCEPELGPLPERGQQLLREPRRKRRRGRW